MRICVAGATGVLGRALVPRLVARGHSVRGIARRAPVAAPPAGVELIEADLLKDDLLEVVRGYDAVIHVATAIPADTSVAGAWDATARLRTTGTRRLLNAALAGGVGRYLQQSIVMAYRDGRDSWLDEHAPLDDSRERAAVCAPVIQMEEMIRDVDPRRLAWAILRGGSFVGAGTAQTALIRQLHAGTATVVGDGMNYVSPVNVADMASAIAAAVEVAPPGTTFNVVDTPLRDGDYLDALADLIGVARPPRIDGPPQPSFRCTNDAARTTLSWWPRERIWPCGSA